MSESYEVALAQGLLFADETYQMIRLEDGKDRIGRAYSARLGWANLWIQWWDLPMPLTTIETAVEDARRYLREKGVVGSTE